MINTKAAKIILPLAFSCLCECDFSALTEIWSKKRKRHLGFDDEMRVTWCLLVPRIRLNWSGKQAQPSLQQMKFFKRIYCISCVKLSRENFPIFVVWRRVKKVEKHRLPRSLITWPEKITKLFLDLPHAVIYMSYNFDREYVLTDDRKHIGLKIKTEMLITEVHCKFSDIKWHNWSKDSTRWTILRNRKCKDEDETVASTVNACSHIVGSWRKTK